jgi:hypothetical protein
MKTTEMKQSSVKSKPSLLIFMLIFGCITALPLVSYFAWASNETSEGPSRKRTLKTTSNVLFLEQLPSVEVHTQALIYLKLGILKADALHFSNSYYRFSYPKHTPFYSFSLGYEALPIEFYGHWGARVDAGYGVGVSTLKLHLLPLSASVVYVADIKRAIQWIAPSFAVGAGYFNYFQTGDLDGVQVRGGSPFLLGSLGLRVLLEGMGFKKKQFIFDYQVTQMTQKINFSGVAFLFGIGSQI